MFFNKLELKDCGDDLKSYTGTFDLYNKNGNKTGKVTIEVPKAIQLEDGTLIAYVETNDEYAKVLYEEGD